MRGRVAKTIRKTMREGGIDPKKFRGDYQTLKKAHKNKS